MNILITILLAVLGLIALLLIVALFMPLGLLPAADYQQFVGIAVITMTVPGTGDFLPHPPRTSVKMIEISKVHEC